MDDAHLNLNADIEDLRRVFGMLTGYVLIPESNLGYTEEFAELDLADRVRTLAAARALWYLLADGVVSGNVAAGETTTTLEDSRVIADEDFALLPAALDLAHRLDEEWTATSETVISTRLVADVAADSTRALGALAYYLRAARIVIHAIADESGRGVDEVLPVVGQRLIRHTS